MKIIVSSNITFPPSTNSNWKIKVNISRNNIGRKPLNILPIGIPPNFKITTTSINNPHIYIRLFNTKTAIININNAINLLLGSSLYKKLLPGIY